MVAWGRAAGRRGRAGRRVSRAVVGGLDRLGLVVTEGGRISGWPHERGSTKSTSSSATWPDPSRSTSSSGADIGDIIPPWADHHREVTSTSPEATVDLDSSISAPNWAAGWAPERTGVVVGFAVEEDDDVDALVAVVEAAGHAVIQPPHDAFFGSSLRRRRGPGRQCRRPEGPGARRPSLDRDPAVLTGDGWRRRE